MLTPYKDHRTGQRIAIGNHVFFLVENQNLWGGKNDGVMKYDHTNDSFYIDTGRLRVTIGQGYDAYPNSLEILDLA